MLLWRLSGAQHADAFDGVYGLRFDGRWNTAGHPVTYCATSPSLCILEKLVHIEDPGLLPAMIMVVYDVPDALGIETVSLEQLPSDWRRRESLTQSRGDEWRRARAKPLLGVPSAIVPIGGSPDVNFVVNHEHPDSARIAIARREAFVFDPRLF